MLAVRIHVVWESRYCEHTIGTHETDAERLALRLVFQFLAPGDGVNSIIILPGLHANDGLAEICEIVESARHRTEDTWNTLLAGHAGAHTDLGPTTSAAADRVDATPGSGHSHRTSNIGSDTDATTLGKKSCFTTSGTTGAVLGEVGIAAVTPETIGRLKGK